MTDGGFDNPFFFRFDSLSGTKHFNLFQTRNVNGLRYGRLRKAPPWPEATPTSSIGNSDSIDRMAMTQLTESEPS